MAASIDQLTDNQAQHALLYFFQELPDRLWPVRKPPFSELASIMELAVEQGNKNQKALLLAVQMDKPHLRGALSKIILGHLEAHPEYEPFVEGSVHYCIQPRMAPVSPIVIRIMITCMAILSMSRTHISVDDAMRESLVTDEHSVRPEDRNHLTAVLDGVSYALKQITDI